MTLSELKSYIKRRLGDPVINIEIDDTQLTDCILDAIQRFTEKHYDAVDIGWIFLDAEEGTKSYTLDDNIQDVTACLSVSSLIYMNDEPLLMKKPYVGDTLEPYFDLVSSEVFRQNLKNIDEFFQFQHLYDYNTTTKKFKLEVAPEEDEQLALRVFSSYTDLTEVYGNRWLKQYCVALGGIQWATNISKYNGATLPGGVSFNSAEIEARYKEMKAELELSLDEEYSEPIDFFIA
jgi:hypothetical protein